MEGGEGKEASFAFIACSVAPVLTRYANVGVCKILRNSNTLVRRNFCWKPPHYHNIACLFISAANGVVRMDVDRV